jgi:hypothetical protein
MPLAPIKIDPDTFYPESSVVLNFGISSTALARGRREGTLRFRRVGGQTLYLGRWLLAWLGHVPTLLPEGGRP